MQTYVLSVMRQLLGALKEGAHPHRLVLTARLAYRRGKNVVKLSLAVESDDPGQPESGALELERPFADFGNLDAYRFPNDLLGEIAAGARKMGLGDHTGPLWLRLARPYGYLGLIPWESSLLQATGWPVLRLPDYPYRAAERTDVLENIVLVDPPADADHHNVRGQVARLATSILQGSARSETRVHVFASTPWQDALASLGSREPRIVLHSPSRAPARQSGPGETAIAPWIDWILVAMERRGADALHIVGRATLAEPEACVRLSASPWPNSGLPRDADLSADDLAMLLNRAGAWSASLVPVAPEYVRPMAFVADDLAHRWHGAVLFSDMAKEEAKVVRAATRLLYSGEATEPPRLTQGFLYCHPDFLLNRSAGLRVSLPPVLRTHAALLAARAPVLERVRNTITRAIPGVRAAVSSAPPSWVAATQRFVEKEMFDELRRRSSDVLLSRASAHRESQVRPVAFDQTRTEVLEEVRAIVARYRAESEEKKS